MNSTQFNSGSPPMQNMRYTQLPQQPFSQGIGYANQGANQKMQIFRFNRIVNGVLNQAEQFDECVSKFKSKKAYYRCASAFITYLKDVREVRLYELKVQIKKNGANPNSQSDFINKIDATSGECGEMIKQLNEMKRTKKFTPILPHSPPKESWQSTWWNAIPQITNKFLTFFNSSMANAADTSLSPSKRSIEQQTPPLTISNPQPLLNVTNFTMCSNSATIGVMGNGQNGQQIVKFYNLQNGTLVEVPDNNNVNGQLPPLLSPANFKSACSNSSFQFITNTISGIWHTIIGTTSGNQTLNTSYPVNLPITDTGNPVVTQSGMTIPTLNNGTSYYTTTNTSGQISSTGPVIDPSTTVNPHLQSLQNLQVLDFHMPANNSKLYVTVYDEYGSVVGTYISDLNQTTFGTQPVEAISGLSTSLPSGASVPIIASTKNGTVVDLMSYSSSTLSITSSQQLPYPGIGPNGKISLADCGNNTYVYAQDVELSPNEFGVGIGWFTLNMTGNTLVSNLTLNFSSSVPCNPQVNCVNNTVIITYKSSANGSIDYVTVTSSSTPSASPAPTPSPSPAASPSPSIVIDYSKIGPNVTLEQVAIISPTVATVIFTGGGTVTQLVNGTQEDVPTLVPYPVDQARQWLIINGTPTFLGCNIEIQCDSSTIKPTTQTAFNIGNNLTYILSSVIPIGVIAIVGSIIFYKTWFLNHRKQLNKRDARVYGDLAPKKAASPEQLERGHAARMEREKNEKPVEKKNSAKIRKSDLTEPLIQGSQEDSNASSDLIQLEEH